MRSRLPPAEPYFLLGESFSGPVAIALAAERPPMLLGLILSCTFARNPLPISTGAQPARAICPAVRPLVGTGGAVLAGMACASRLAGNPCAPCS
ncbi:alpha/beta hydrolase [Massilia sp. B-10]|nr:alpha/beta hydrolase [Massilia sp. B-10]